MADEKAYGKFADGFMWGTATASYQIEGAWNKDGKGESVWDRHSHESGKIEDKSNGDVACDSYHNYEQDVEMMKNLKVNHYRFSLSWSRLLPTADAGKPNQAGIDYYNKLINALLNAGVQPCVTLYHWDLPQCLHDKGGWLDDMIIDKFEEYANFCFEKFGDRVKMWITINEPHVNCIYGYGLGNHAPGIQDPFNGFYKVSRTMLLSHAKAWHKYDTRYRAQQKGQISITLNSDWCEAKDPSKEEDRKAAELYLEATLGWFAHPVYVDGDYPAILKEVVAKKSEEFGMDKSRFPVISDEEKALIKGTHDFFGLNHYTTRLGTPMTKEMEQHRLHPDLDAFIFPNPEWERAGSEWLYIAPWGLRKLLKHIATTYGNPTIIVTENGCSSKHPVGKEGDIANLEDEQRCNYISSYINEALKAVQQDGVKLQGYFLWSLMDNFEWAAGYTERFGLHYVDFTDAARPRKARKSCQVFREIIENNGFTKSRKKF